MRHPRSLPARPALRRLVSPAIPAPARWAPAIGALALLAGACNSTRTRTERIDALITDGEYAAAARAASEWREDAPKNSAAERAHLRASVAILLDRARRETLAGNDEYSLELVGEALELAPANPVVLDWDAKVRRKLANKWLDRAYELEGAGALEAALEAYEHVVEQVPDDRAGLLGVARVLERQQYRVERGLDYYQEGVRRLREALLEQARQKFEYTAKYLPEDDRVESRVDNVRTQIAGERVRVARHYEDRKLFPAAMTEYRVALHLDPDNEEATEGLERAERESRAIKRLEAADMLVRKGRLEDAREELTAGLEYTTQQTEAFERKRIDIEENALRVLYERAYDLESDFRYERAIAAYDELLEESEYYEDALTRRDTLAEYVELAADLYARAAESESPEEELDLLLQVDLFYPEYRDVPERIRALEKAVAAAETAEPAEDPESSSGAGPDRGAAEPGAGGEAERSAPTPSEDG